MLLDKNGFFDCNNATLKMFGCSSKEEFCSIHPADVSPPLQPCGKNSTTLSNQYIELALERGNNFFEWTHKKINTGEVFPAEVLLNKMELDGKTVLQAVVRDITERKFSEDEIKLKNEQLQKTNSEKDKFFSIISHDIRGPLSGLMGLTKMLSEDIKYFNSKKIQDIATLMNESSITLYRFIENFLEWSRMQMKIFTFSPKMYNIKNLSDNAINNIKYNSEKKTIVVHNEIPDNLEIFVDENMISSVLRNLISNALKFTPKGGEITITSAQLIDKSIKISISDTGIGMNKKTLDKLFQIDQKVSSPGTEDEPGTGLGLLLCKEFVEKHGGKIWAESEEGKGSTFSFTIM